MDIIIDELIIEEDRSEHIARHGVIIKEVQDIVSGNYVFIKGRGDRWLLIGNTKRRRCLTIVVGERRQKNTYGLVTARPSSKEERSFYQEFTLQQGGEENGQNKKN